MAATKIITPHFNPTRSKRLAGTHSQWIESLGKLASLVTCYELVFDDREPEIPGSRVIRGTSERNLMWQKEALVNLALRECDEDVQYFGWIDHDLVWDQGRHWLSEAIERIDTDTPFVQLFSEVQHLNRDGSIVSNALSRVAGGIKAPGGAWLANRHILDSMGGLYDRAIVGGGDEWCWCGFNGSVGPNHNVMRMTLTRPMFLSICDYIRAGQNAKASTGCIDCTVSHLWHGDEANRQYHSRTEILKRYDYDPAADVQLNDDGILEWASDKPGLRLAVKRYFESRKDDG